MLRRLVAAAAVVVAVAACETATEDTGTAGTAGGAGVGAAGSGPVTGMPSGGGSSSGYGTGGVQRSTLGSPGDVEREMVSVGDTVYFVFDSYSLDSQSQATLDRQAALLLKYTAIQATIEGHTDERGTREYNLALGDRRANAVRDYLIAYGIAPNRLRTISYGEERPAMVGSTEAAWAKNRRAVTVVVGSAAGS